MSTPTTVTQTETNDLTVTASTSECSSATETSETKVQTDTGSDTDSGAGVNTESGSDSLSTVAKAGIGAGVGAWALLILAAGRFWFFRRPWQANEDRKGVPVIPTGAEPQGMVTKSSNLFPAATITTPANVEQRLRLYSRHELFCNVLDGFVICDVEQFSLRIDYWGGALTTTTTFEPMGMKGSSTVLPASFLPAMGLAETSDIDIRLYTVIMSSGVGIDNPEHTDVSLVVPVPTPITVTFTSRR
ncbi:hypothetical protein BJY01DRAFT_252838 [Aspergillus pseudoustus]|uniref:Uncharacterized protein n=1 Tax=Aspergillus pseudoustus TaxID=1810923 RepID=A0ABR4J6X7_9EURO